MSGESPNGFEIYRSDNVVNSVTASQLSNEIRDWIGVEGFLDMRAYVRFRFLDYFKNQLLPNELENELKLPSISEEEVAINALVIDFALKHKYYFTLCLLISEIQAFSRIDERLKPLLARISSMSTDEMEKLSPLLNEEQVRRVLWALKIDPQSQNGMNIHQAYFRNEKRLSLIQLVLSCNNNQGGSGVKLRRRTKAVETELWRVKEKLAGKSRDLEIMKGSIRDLMQLVDQTHAQGNQVLQRFGPYINQVLTSRSLISRMEVDLRRVKRKLIAQSNRSKARSIKRETNARLEKASIRLGVNIGELSEVGGLSLTSPTLLISRYLYSIKPTSTVINDSQKPALGACEHLNQLEIKEIYVSHDHPRLVNHRSSFNGTFSSSVIEPRPNELNIMKQGEFELPLPAYKESSATGVLVDKTVQTDMVSENDLFGRTKTGKMSSEVSIQTELVSSTDAYTQSETNQDTAFPLAASNPESCKTDLLSASQRIDDDAGLSKECRHNSVQTNITALQWQETLVIMEHNNDLQRKILEQTKRICYLTARIAQVHEEIARYKMEEQTHQARLGITRTDASTNTEDIRRIPSAPDIRHSHCKIKLNVSRNLPHFDPAPLKKALAAAKEEVVLLKRERQNIQDQFVSKTH